MLVSVIMPVFNSIQFLHESIKSILNQTHEDLEFIILDDCSTESVWEALQFYKDTRIVALRNSKNIGLTKSLNICLDKVRGDFVVRHDSDDISFPNRIEKQLTLFEKGVGFVGSWAKSIDKFGNYVTGYVETHCRSSNEDLKVRYPKLNCMPDPTTIYSIEAIRKVGYFDEALYLAQTYNYNRRVQRFFNGQIVPEILYLRRIWPDAIGKRIKRINPQFRKINWLDYANSCAEVNTVISTRERHLWED